MRYLKNYIQTVTYLVILFALLIPPVYSQDPLKKLSFKKDKQKSLSLPFKLVNNLIIIPIKINNSGSLNFILDTGLTTTLLTELNPGDSVSLIYAREIQLQGLGQGEPLKAIHSYGNEISIKNISGNNQDIYFVPENLFNLSARHGIPINGILGYSIFSNFIIKIDYIGRTIHFYDPDKFIYSRKYRKYNTIPILMHKTKPYIFMKVTDNGSNIFDIKVLLDTGASQSLWIDPNSLDDFIHPENSHFTFLGFGLNGEIFGEISRLQSLELGGFKLNQPIVSFPDSASIVSATEMNFRNGSVGSEVLRRFDLIIDLPNNKLHLKPNSNFREHFTQNLSGMELLSPYSSLPIYVVENVRIDSPAWNAGLREGDEISSINDISTSKLELNEIYQILQSRPNRKILIRAFRDGKPFNTSFRLEEYL